MIEKFCLQLMGDHSTPRWEITRPLDGRSLDPWMGDHSTPRWEITRPLDGRTLDPWMGDHSTPGWEITGPLDGRSLDPWMGDHSTPGWDPLLTLRISWNYSIKLHHVYLVDIESVSMNKHIPEMAFPIRLWSNTEYIHSYIQYVHLWFSCYSTIHAYRWIDELHVNNFCRSC